jgi:Winged helix DNA-binding domain
MDLTEQIRAWTYARQRIGDPASSPTQALNAVVGVYATHPTAPLALWARTRSFTPAAYRRIDKDGKGLRIPCMRKTVFLIPRRIAAKVFTAVRPSAAHALRPLKWQRISPQTYEKLAKKILVAAKEPRSTVELGKVAGIKGEKLGTVLRCLRYEGRIVTMAGNSLLSSPHAYVATKTVEPDGLDSDQDDKALAWLAGEYLRAYGPARVEDFAWWTGVTKTLAAKAVESHRSVDVGEGLLLLKRDEAKFDRTKKVRDSVALLPKWDSYTMGHAPEGRSRFVHPDVQERVYTPLGAGLPGDGNPVVLVDGEVAATWTFSKKDGAEVQPFDKLGPKIRKRVGEKLDAVAELLVS